MNSTKKPSRYHWIRLLQLSSFCTIKMSSDDDATLQATLREEVEQNRHAVTMTAKEKPAELQYRSKINEFIAWTKAKKYRDTDTVTSGKLALFLNQEVVNRIAKRGKFKGKCTCFNVLIDYPNSISLLD